MIRPARPFAAALLFLAVLLTATAARADDVADEADLQFRLGAQRFQARDFQGALEHFLASNRLVPNRNVTFNIAYTYEQLGLFADAHRYFTRALEGEKDPKERERISGAIARIAPKVAVLRVETEPPGATLYVDRKDLGARGESPRVLAFPAGKYRVIAEKEGFEPVESEPLELSAGREITVHLVLKRILATLRVDGLAGTQLFDETGREVGTVPCILSVVPGRHDLVAKRDGFQALQLHAELAPDETQTLKADLQPQTGTLVIDADERGAAVEVDGKVVGFTPAVATLPVGERRLRVTHKGFRPVERTVTIRANEQRREELVLEALEEVSAASRTEESVDDAPTSVTILDGRELRAFGYPTLAEALRGARGVSTSDDRSYALIGMRGFEPAGSYGNRVLVLMDGHTVNDDWIGSSYTGYDARVDLDDVERIEIVRGPGSVLYGTGAFSGVVNVVTVNRDAPTATTLRLGTAEYGFLRAHLTQSWRASPEAGLHLALAGGQSAGRDYFFPEFAASGSDGNSRGADGFRAGMVSARGWWKDLTLQGFYNLRDKSFPTGEYATLLGDPRNVFEDGRGFVELRFEPRLSESVQLMTRAFTDRYTYASNLLGLDADGGHRQETYEGIWSGAEVRLVTTPLRFARIMVGAEGQLHFRVVQKGTEQLDTDTPARYLDLASPFRVGAAYALADLTFSRVHLSGGVRLDAYTTFGSSVNPRVAAVVKPWEKGVLKLMFGRAFRAPSIYELYYNDGGISQLPACDPSGKVRCTLLPENMTSGEVELTHHFTPSVSGLVSVYANYIEHLIALRTTDAGLGQYQNTGVPVLVPGVETELRRDWRAGWTTSVGYSYQRARYVQRDVPASEALREVANSPRHLASTKVAFSIVPRAFVVASRLSVEGPRFDRFERADDPPQGTTPPAFLWDVVLSGEISDWGASWSLGAYNLADWKYALPVSTEFEPLRSVPQNGRTVLASLGVTL